QKHHHHDDREDERGVAEIPSGLEELTEPTRDEEELAGHERAERERPSELRAGENSRKRGGERHGEEEARTASPERLRGTFELRRHVTHGGLGGHGDRQKS